MRLDISGKLEVLKGQNPDMFREFFELNCMEIRDAHVDGRRVLDIGANLGFFALKCCTLGADSVLAVEPQEDNYRVLLSNVSDVPAITPLNCAVSDSRTSAVSMIEEKGIAKSVPDPSGGVPAKSLRELLAWFPKGDDGMVLKVDTEGSEYDILLDASGEDIRRFEYVFLETHQVPHLESREARTARYMEEYMGFLGYEIESRRKLYHWGWDAEGNLNEYREIENQESWCLRRR